MIIKPKNWSEFQHYKYRSPPWIRLHRSLLDNYDFFCLHDASKVLAMCLWLLASESVEGEIDADPKKLAFRFRTTEKAILESIKELIEGGFFDVASGELAECSQDASAVLIQSRVEKSRGNKKTNSHKTSIPENFIVSDRVKRWALKRGITNLDAHLESFKRKCRAKGYKYIDWDAAFENAVSDDWAKIGYGTETEDGFQPAQ